MEFLFWLKSENMITCSYENNIFEINRAVCFNERKFAQE